MDPGFPRGGIERAFAQYDRITSHHPPDHEMHKDEPEAKKDPPHVPGDEPPWWSPDDMDANAKGPPITQAEHEQGVLKNNLGHDPQKSWRDIDADRMAAADQRMNQHLKTPNGATFQQDEQGLDRAYNDETAPGVYYDPATRTEYIKGSSTRRDWYDDATKIPDWGDTENAERYQQADKARKDLNAQGKVVDRVVGHSLGGSVALQMQSDYDIPKSRTFGAPVVDLKPFDRYYNKAERYRHPTDPVSIMDRGATWGDWKAYPHTYTGFQNLDKVHTQTYTAFQNLNKSKDVMRA